MKVTIGGAGCGGDGGGAALGAGRLMKRIATATEAPTTTKMAVAEMTSVINALNV